ncbi:hypothetical protein AeRB84_001201 [Aphanomyces euteiches]|nr:hypothetical protein AeRB84_001201 [Aphanomyces euteiches]
MASATKDSSVASKFPTEAKGQVEEEQGHIPRSKQIAGFVSTSVLSSSDGLFGDNVEEVRITDRPENNGPEKVDNRPLYERLKEQKDQRDAEWKEKNNPFAPPKGLDDEEIDFLRNLESDQKKIQEDIKRQQEAELEKFASAMLKREAQTKKPVVVAAKIDSSNAVPLEKHIIRPSVKPKTKKTKATGDDSVKPSKKVKTSSLVAAYSDDSD